MLEVFPVTGWAACSKTFVLEKLNPHFPDNLIQAQGISHDSSQTSRERNSSVMNQIRSQRDLA